MDKSSVYSKHNDEDPILEKIKHLSREKRVRKFKELWEEY